MTRRTYLGGVAAVCATILVSAALLAQDKPQGEGDLSPMMKAWMAYATPGEHHQVLEQRAGEWTYTGTYWEYPGAEPKVFDGTAHSKMIMDGRYLVEKVEGDMEGQPFHGMGIFGFDNLLGRYTGVWLDNMSTGLLQYEAPAGTGTTIDWTGQQPDPLAGVYNSIRSVDQMPDPDHKVPTAYATVDGQEVRQMVLRYTRVTKDAEKDKARDKH